MKVESTDIVASEVGNVILTPTEYEIVKASDPVVDANVVETGGAQHIMVTLAERARWVCRRVYSEYLSREVFTDPQGVEWVRISDAAFNPETDIQVEMRSRGLSPMGLRRRDAAAANLKKKE